MRVYETNFLATENPLSEGGVWDNGGVVGLRWNNVMTTPGRCHGVPSEHDPQYADPTAILKGNWGSDQEVEAVVFQDQENAGYFQEVEIRLRSVMQPNFCSGYEVFWRVLKTANGYFQIVRWNGQFGDFTYLADLQGAQYGAGNGDRVKARIRGNKISAWLNGVLVTEVIDDVFKTGRPGLGFNYGMQATNDDFGFTYYKATSGILYHF